MSERTKQEKRASFLWLKSSNEDQPLCPAVNEQNRDFANRRSHYLIEWT